MENNPELVNYQDEKYGTTLLIWAVGMEKYRSYETLLKYGADPDIICSWKGETALYAAAGYSWIDSFAKEDSKYVMLLIEYGADPNICFAGHMEIVKEFERQGVNYFDAEISKDTMERIQKRYPDAWQEYIKIY